MGSRIKGHAKRGGSKMTRQHRPYRPVGHTNENRTSKICSCYYILISLARATRTKDGQTKTARLNGLVDCKNPTCPRRKAGRGSMGSDANVANNVLISGASILLSADHRALPPYHPFALPTTMTARANELDIETSTHSHPSCDAPRVS